nr:MAG TPA: hypothetical protein [Caudoviricetes sp.]
MLYNGKKRQIKQRGIIKPLFCYMIRKGCDYDRKAETIL